MWTTGQKNPSTLENLFVFHTFCKYKYKILVGSKIVILLYYSFFLTYTTMYWLRLHVHQFTPVLFFGNDGVRETNVYPISALTGLYSTWATEVDTHRNSK